VNRPGLHLLFLLAHPARAAGQDLMNEPIGFRSGFTEGAATTRPGTLTLDAGTSTRWADGTTTYRIGELNVRAPVSRRAEVRLYVNSYAWRVTRGERAAGREDLSLALAAMVLTHHGLRPVAGLIVRLDIPTGTLPRRERSWRPSARWSLGWELPGRVALHSNLGVAREARAAEDYTRAFASVWLWRRLVGHLGAYAEAYGSTRERPVRRRITSTPRSPTWCDPGCTWTCTPASDRLPRDLPAGLALGCGSGLDASAASPISPRRAAAAARRGHHARPLPARA
jgi:hypothetical protein